jgi:hypothetical protein
MDRSKVMTIAQIFLLSVCLMGAAILARIIVATRLSRSEKELERVRKDIGLARIEHLKLKLEIEHSERFLNEYESKKVRPYD